MTLEELKDYYKSGYRFHKETGISKSNYSYWFKRGYIPYEAQRKIERFTNGQLKFTFNDEENKNGQSMGDQ